MEIPRNGSATAITIQDSVPRLQITVLVASLFCDSLHTVLLVYKMQPLVCDVKTKNQGRQTFLILSPHAIFLRKNNCFLAELTPCQRKHILNFCYAHIKDKPINLYKT